MGVMTCPLGVVIVVKEPLLGVVVVPVPGAVVLFIPGVTVPVG